ncbi:hypothetical protein FACS189496_4450 [Bacilli bacterium]|nr:hypothetical protein FACS189496_4450 [Bacilli bacterium]
MKNTNTTLSNKKKKIVLSILLGTASVVVAPIILMQCNNSKTDQPLSPSKLIINYAGNISISTSESVERIFTIEDDIGNKIEDAIFSSEAASDESVVSKPNITCISGNKYKFSLTGKKEGNATISFKAANDKLDGALSDIYINVKTNPSILCPILSNTQFTVAANKTTSFDFKVQDDKGNIVNDAE